MISSSSYSGCGGVYEEALTSQPRSSKNHPYNVINNMDLRYVTERIIALWFPSTISQQSFKQGQRQAADMLNNKHGDNYMVIFLLIIHIIVSFLRKRDNN